MIEDTNDDSLIVEEDDNSHPIYVFKCCLFLAIKMIILATARYSIYVMQSYKETNYMFSHWILLGVILFYIIILIFYGAAHNHLPFTILPVMNLILFILELLIIINLNYSIVCMITMAFLTLYFLLTGIVTQAKGVFSLPKSLLLLLVFGTINIAVFFLTSMEHFHTHHLGYMNFNIFLGFYVFSVWCCLYFADI